MAMRKTRPTSPGRRFATYQQREELTSNSKPLQGADQGQEVERRAQRPRPYHRAPSWRRRQAPLSRDRLQATQGRHRGQGRDGRVRPQPHLLHRPAALRRRRQELRPRTGGDQGRRRRSVRRGSRHSRRQRAAAALDPDRHHRPQRRDGPRPGRQARTLGRLGDPGRRQGGRDRDAAPAVVGDAHGSRRLPRHDRHALQRRASKRQGRQGRAASATWACARSREESR